MISISLKNGRNTINLCLCCGRKLNVRRRDLCVIRPSHYFHPRCHSTKVIRGCANNNRCEISYNSDNATIRYVKELVNRAYFLNTSFAVYILNAMKQASVLSGRNIFYTKQNPWATGAIHASSPTTDGKYNENMAKDSNSSREQDTISNTVKVRYEFFWIL